MSTELPKIVVILGPTASGKTKMALALAQRFHGEIISADSRQVYREMDIGTDKISGIISERDGRECIMVANIPHFLIDIRSPAESFSVAEYQKLAYETIDEITRRGNVPILVGGTGLYIASVVDNYHIPDGEPNRKLRELLEDKSVQQLALELAIYAPHAIGRVDMRNKRRLARALEIALNERGGVEKKPTRGEPRYQTLQIGIRREMSQLYEKINTRVDEYIERGFVSEVQGIVSRYGDLIPALSGIGYSQIVSYLRGDYTLQQAIRLIKRDTRHYAKRQMTWFRRDKSIRWVENIVDAEELLEKFL